MKATEAKFLEFLKKSPQFIIPIYQRTYSWTERECRQLWDDIMRTGAIPANAADCDNPIAKIAAFARQHRITGTPTTILSDGRRLVGAVPRAELETQLLRAARP